MDHDPQISVAVTFAQPTGGELTVTFAETAYARFEVPRLIRTAVARAPRPVANVLRIDIDGERAFVYLEDL